VVQLHVCESGCQCECVGVCVNIQSYARMMEWDAVGNMWGADMRECKC